MNKEEFLTSLIDIQALKFGDFTLASGAKSQFYLDLRVIPYNNDFFLTIMEQFAQKLTSEVQFDIICGIPLAGIPFATLIAYHSKKPLVFLRKSPKGYGLNKLIEGGEVKNRTVLLVDDLISSGFSKEFAINELRKEGAIVNDLAVLVDRRDDSNNSNKEWENKFLIKVNSYFQLSKQEILNKKN